MPHPELTTMSQQEINRLEVIQQIEAKRLTQRTAAQQLGLSTRQLRRLQAAYRRHGAQALVSKRRGQPSNHRLSESFRQTILSLIQANYADFGPTLACEKLAEQHQLTVSVETVRKLMSQAGLWQPKVRGQCTIHPQRARRAALGDLVQIDGSLHAWFEDRGERCCLLVAIDDATGRLMQLRFEPVESTAGYFRLFKDYLQQHGLPVACYHDKHGIFQVNIKEPLAGQGITQFGRAMKALGIESISAHTPQAKGRVERVNKTLQDRLVKELRLQGIDTREAANAFLPQFIASFNRKFAVLPRLPDDAHQHTLPDEDSLQLIFSEQYQRTISRQLEVSFQGQLYQIQTDQPRYTMRQAKVMVCVDLAGQVTLRYKGRNLPYRVLNGAQKAAVMADLKTLDYQVDQAKKQRTVSLTKPADTHPWRQSYKQAISRNVARKQP